MTLQRVSRIEIADCTEGRCAFASAAPPGEKVSRREWAGKPKLATVLGVEAGDGGDAPSSLLVIDARSLTRDCLVAALLGAGIDRVIAVANIDQAIRHIEMGCVFKAVFINLAADEFSQESLAAITEPLSIHLPHSPLLLLSERMNAKHAAVAVRHGVHGFLSSDMALDLTIAAIHFVELGWTLFPSELFPSLSRQGFMPGSNDPDLTWHLTGRQIEVLHHLRTGMANKNIARLLGIGERTVKAHVKGIMRRFGVTNRTQIVALLSRYDGHLDIV